MNRTVLDMVSYAEAKDLDPLTYEDVLVWDGSKLVPLLERHESEWLCHFTLGSIFESGRL